MNTLKPPADSSFCGPPDAIAPVRSPSQAPASPSQAPASLEHVQSFHGLGLTAWLVVILALGVALVGREAVALPRPVAAEELSTVMATLRQPTDSGGWMAVHVLYAGSRCSRPIADHLLLSARPADFSERVLLVGRDADLERRLAESGVAVQLTNPAELADRYRIENAPLLVVVAPDGTVRYAGGYSAPGEGADPADLDILSDTRAGVAREPLPVVACPVRGRLVSSMTSPRLL